jgi:hypothetical protein
MLTYAAKPDMPHDCRSHRLSLRTSSDALRRACARPSRPYTSAYVSIRQHTSAYVSIRRHTSAYVSIPFPFLVVTRSALQHPSSLSIARTRGSTSRSGGGGVRSGGGRGGGSLRREPAAPSIFEFAPSTWQHRSARVSIRQHTSAYVSIRQHT